jgi:hypothetical protein
MVSFFFSGKLNIHDILHVTLEVDGWKINASQNFFVAMATMTFQYGAYFGLSSCLTVFLAAGKFTILGGFFNNCYLFNRKLYLSYRKYHLKSMKSLLKLTTVPLLW